MSINPTALRTFYLNEVERETVKAFMIDMLGEMAKDKAFKGEDVSGIKEAKALIDTSFDKLQELYGKIEEKPLANPR